MLKVGHILTENLDFIGHLSTFRAENTPKIGLLRPKKMLKNFLNNSKTTLKKSIFTQKYAPTRPTQPNPPNKGHGS